MDFNGIKNIGGYTGKSPGFLGNSYYLQSTPRKEPSNNINQKIIMVLVNLAFPIPKSPSLTVFLAISLQNKKDIVYFR